MGSARRCCLRPLALVLFYPILRLGTSLILRWTPSFALLPVRFHYLGAASTSGLAGNIQARLVSDAGNASQGCLCDDSVQELRESSRHHVLLGK